ncbi:AAA family ATPase [Zhaonella formicivorans]|uniref:ATP-binding protein n=1 Tax=Zhaonella formicivorans TaxID=2528593 RepID=UPI0010F11859|nr:AAA family ATPase [Zhaonella formicivorans]
MTKYIAVAGKGGTGKTTFTALLIKYLSANNKKAILAVDADPNANLNEALGLNVEFTISDILNELKDPKAVPAGMTKDIFVEYKLSQSIIETKDIDLLVMGGPQGPGCYCYANDLLRKHLETLGKNYEYVIVDSEAGLEHISRKTIPRVDTLFVISDCSARGIRSAGRVYQLLKSLNNQVGLVQLVVTKVNEEQLKELEQEIVQTGLALGGTVPFDPMVIEFDVQSKPLISLPEASPAVQAVFQLLHALEI